MILNDPRQAQIATWTKMRQAGRLRYIALRGVGSGACVAAPLIGVAWIKTGILAFTIEAVIGFIIVGFMSAVSARSEWNRLASIYPDIGGEPDRAGNG
jgi:hypothetical protein